MKDHKLRVLDSLACDAAFSDSPPVSYVYGTCSCGERVAGAKSEDELRRNHDQHVHEVKGEKKDY